MIEGRKTKIDTRNCAACGAETRRINAKFCLVCGKLLREDYQPLDTLRSSYRLQGRPVMTEAPKPVNTADLFARDENTVSETAWACFVYSMVPYIGVLFIPFTFIIGTAGIALSYRKPRLGGRRLALVSIGLSFVVLAIQVFFWWLLYIIPELGRGVQP